VVRKITRGSYMRRKLYFTDRGLARLISKDYRVFRPGAPAPTPEQETFLRHAASTRSASKRDGGRPLASYSAQEQRMRLRDVLHRAALAYLDHPCAVPACPCAIHRIHKVPQSHYIRELIGY